LQESPERPDKRAAQQRHQGGADEAQISDARRVATIKENKKNDSAGARDQACAGSGSGRRQVGVANEDGQSATTRKSDEGR
jgi:hypothetical protein